MTTYQAKSRFKQSIQLSETNISEFANAAGDTNPLHHNKEFARSRGFSSIIASGPHTSALLMGMVANYFSNFGPMVGLEFSFFFKDEVPANTPLELEWLIIRVRRTKKQPANLVELRGRMRTKSGVTAVGAKGTVLVYENESAQ